MDIDKNRTHTAFLEPREFSLNPFHHRVVPRLVRVSNYGVLLQSTAIKREVQHHDSVPVLELCRHFYHESQ